MFEAIGDQHRIMQNGKADAAIIEAPACRMPSDLANGSIPLIDGQAYVEAELTAYGKIHKDLGTGHLNRRLETASIPIFGRSLWGRTGELHLALASAFMILISNDFRTASKLTEVYCPRYDTLGGGGVSADSTSDKACPN